MASFQNSECLPGISGVLLGAAQDITLAPDGTHLAFVVIDGPELAANLTDMHVQAAVMLDITTLQHLLIEEGLAQHLLAAAIECVQQTVFAGRKASPLPFMTDIASLFIEVQAGALPSQWLS